MILRAASIQEELRLESERRAEMASNSLRETEKRVSEEEKKCAYKDSTASNLNYSEKTANFKDNGKLGIVRNPESLVDARNASLKPVNSGSTENEGYVLMC